MIQIIPAIDLMAGKCVRLRQGDFGQQTVYSQNPIDVAKSFEGAGLRRLHLVDLDGARAGKPQNLSVLRSIAAETNLVIDFSGGIRTDEDLNTVLEAGAAVIAIGSLAVKAPELLKKWTNVYGPQRFLIGADVRDGRIAINGWEQLSGLNVFGFVEGMLELGLCDIFCTDVSVDGTLEGPSISLYSQLLQRFPELRLIASGGVRNLEDVRALEGIGCSGVIIGKALYEGGVSLESITAQTEIL